MAIGAQTFSLPFQLSTEVENTVQRWQQEDCVQRLWRRDASLWTGASEADWLGWLEPDGKSLAATLGLEDFRSDILGSGATHVLLLGMGGSSLCPEVLAETFGPQPPHPQLRVLDSTDPARIAAVEAAIDLRQTLFIVSSKSGTTLETRVLMRYFFDRVQQELGAAEAGRRFIAITDPGSELEAWAGEKGFRAVLAGRPDIGGRFSALSAFGLAPAAAMGVDAGQLVARAEAMAEACGPAAPVASNPGAVLGIVLGVLANSRRDKLTFIASPAVSSLGGWIEQLIAESTGKDGKGLIPIDGEPPGPVSTYGRDRAFVYLRFTPAPDPAQDRFADELEEVGQPLVRIDLDDFYDLGREFYRWEFATAVAGALMGVNPFDQPDVEANKAATRKLTREFEDSGVLPPEHPLFDSGVATLFASPAATLVLSAVGPGAGLADYVSAYLALLQEGDYFALLAYIEMSAAHRERLQAIRRRVRDSRRVATTVGFGPRFLHSTGQAHKGGPDHGVFLQITCDDRTDLPVPGERYSFGVVKAAQARGDFSVLSGRGRLILRVHLRELESGLTHLEKAF